MKKYAVTWNFASAIRFEVDAESEGHASKVANHEYFMLEKTDLCRILLKNLIEISEEIESIN